MTGFGRILADLNRAGVRYVLIGGIAVIRHGFVRATRDIDAIVSQSATNRKLIRNLVMQWEATRPDGSSIPGDSFEPGRDLHLLTRYGEVDLLADHPPPLSFEELSSRADARRVDSIPAPIVSFADLVALKRLAGRDQDLFDLRNLEEAHGGLPEPPPPQDEPGQGFSGTCGSPRP